MAGKLPSPSLQYGGMIRSFQYGGDLTKPLPVGLAPIRPLTSGQVLQNFARGLPPSQYENLLPSQREWLGGIVSGLGMPPEDFFQSIQRSFPNEPQWFRGVRSDF